jgi:hypothetical protein
MVNRANWVRFAILPSIADRPISLGISLIRANTGLGGRSTDIPYIWNCRHGMALQPQSAGSDGRINASIFPPFGFITAAMSLAVMAPA